MQYVQYVSMLATLMTVLSGAIAGSAVLAVPRGIVVVALGSNIPNLDPWKGLTRLHIITSNWHIHDNLFIRDL